MIIRLYIVFLFIPLHSYAQIRPFEDYSKCLNGFRGTFNDTVIPAKFDAAIAFNNDYRSNNFHYLVSEKGKWGWLNANGTWVLEAKYESLKYESSPELVFAKLNGKCGTFSLEGTQRIPFIYDTIYNGLRYYRPNSPLLTEVNQKLGLCASNGKELIPNNYAKIEQYEFLEDSVTYGLCYYAFTENELHTYSEDGELLFTKPLIALRSFYSDQNAGHDAYWEMPDLFLFQNPKGMYSVMDRNGKEFLPFSKYPYEPVYTLEAYLSDKRLSFAREWNTSHTLSRLTSLSTVKSSPWYSQIQFLKNNIYAKGEDRWYLLDTNFRVVNEQKYINEQLNYPGNWNYMENDLPGDSDWGDLYAYYECRVEEKKGVEITPIFFVKRWYKNKKKIKVGDKSYPSPRIEYVGLFNGTTKAATPIVYKEILTLRQKNTSYFWAIHGNDFNGEHEFSADVYDENLNLLRTVCTSNDEIDIIQSYLSDAILETDKPLLISSQASGEERIILHRIRWFDGSAPKVHQFEDVVMEYFVDQDSTGYVLLQKNRDHFYIRNIQGIPDQYENKVFTNTENIYYGDLGEHLVCLADSTGTITILNNKFDIVIDSCSRKFVELTPNSTYRDIYQRANFFVIRKGCVYAFIQGHFILMDASFFIKPKDYNHVTGMLYVDNSGKLLTDEDLEFRSQPSTGKIGMYNISLVKKELKLTHIKTSQIITFSNIVRFSTDGGRRLIVKTTEKKCGLINPNTGDWLVKPLYDTVATIEGLKGDHFFARDHSIGNGKWFVITADGTKITNAEFDGTVLFQPKQNYAFAYSNSRIGTIDTNFNWITTPKFRKHAVIEGKQVFFDDNNDYVFLDKTKGVTFNIPHDSVNFLCPSRFVFYRSGFITITDISGKVLLADASKKHAVQANLVALLQYNASTGFIIYGGDLMKVSAENKALTKRNNENILVNLAGNCHNRKRMTQLAQSPYNETVSRSDNKRLPYRYTEKIYVEKTLGYYPGYKNTTCPNAYYYTGKFTNFRIVNDSLVEIKQLSELFLPKSGYETQLNTLLEKAIQREQALGLVCADMDATIEQMKQNFVIEPGKLSFVECNSRKILAIPVAELEEYLLMKELFE